tara:strand:- start:1037 stop:1444 length:408 start_codon:yes stop_codon:yes gene_type:complete
MLYLNHKIQSEKFIINDDEIISFATSYDPMFFHLNKNEAQDSIFKELVASGLHSICIILQKINEFSEWMVATGLEHNVKYLKPVLPEVQYKVTGYVYEENLWKNPKYTQLKMKNALVNLEEEELVILSTNFLIYS